MYGFRNDNAEPKHQAPFIAQRKMKRILSIIVTCVFPCLALTGLSPSAPLHYRLASDPKGSHVFVKYHLPDKTEWIVDNEIPHSKTAPVNASPLDLIFLLSNAKSAPVDVELKEGLNHLGYF
jgi:hypothetical protein